MADETSATDRGGRPAAGLDDLVARLGGEAGGPGPAPVDDWNPPFCGDIDMRIARDGTWYYCGTPIRREAMVRLFASVLRREADGRHLLVTPAEKCGITVEDVPFLAVELVAEGEGAARRIAFRTNVGDTVVADAAHPLRFVVDPANGGLEPYVLVRGRLEARATRAVVYDLIEAGDEHMVDGVAWFGVWSGGAFFPIVPVAETETVA